MNSIKSIMRAIFNNLLGLLYYPLRLKNKLGNSSNHRLRVLSFHDIDSKDEKKFERQLIWVMKNWDIIDPLEFEKVLEGKVNLKRDSLLLTFDDGTISNFNIAKNILSNLNIKALFFIVTKYALIENLDESKIFAAKNIMLIDDASDVHDNFENMRAYHLKELINDGHTIGSHTLSHARLSELSGEKLHKEINIGADILENLIGQKIKHFAYPFGNIQSISKEASIEATKRFQFVYSSFRGDNALVDNKNSNLLRDSNDPNDTLWYTGACLEGVVDFLYAKKINLF
jgi:peptidoglycan/xylan/chitin deacetylase (PgdA/CDA1 family)